MPEFKVELTGLMLSPGGDFLSRVYTWFKVLPNGQRMVHSTRCIVVFKGGVFKEYPDLSLAALNAELEGLERKDAQDTKGIVTSGWSLLADFDHWGLSVTLGPLDQLLAAFSAVSPSVAGRFTL